MSALFDLPEPIGAVETESVVKWTERMVLDLLLERYAISGGNGQRYACAEHVRSSAGFDARRTADFIAMSLWDSDDLALHGHEVKVSRSDWLTELRDPSKAEAFRPYMDYWWLVASDKSIVRDDLPDGWGLMAPRADGKLAIVKRAPRREPEPMPKTLMACLLRATGKTAQRALTRNERAISWTATCLSRRGLEYDRDGAADLLASVRQAVGL